MATPPRITRAELIGHIDLIAKRRQKIDDPHRELLPAADNQLGTREVLDVLDYLRKYPTVHRWVQQADAVNALQLTVWLWWEDRRRELHWLKIGRQRGLFLSQLGAPFGIGKRGVIDRVDRLEALLQFDRPDEQLSRELRRAGANRAEETVWVRQHADALRALTEELVAAADRFALAEDERPMLDELALDARDDAFTPGSMALLGLATAELATARPVAELGGRPQPYAVHRTLERAQQLLAEFGALGKTHAASKDDLY